MKLAWVTDVHLNFLGANDVDLFFRSLAAVRADGLLLSGDIGEANYVVDYLNALNGVFQRPVYFVLGNHDFYQGSIADVRAKVDALCGTLPGPPLASECRGQAADGEFLLGRPRRVG